MFCLHLQYLISTSSDTEADEEKMRRTRPGFTKAVYQDLLTTVEMETRGKEKRERTSETPAATVIPTTQDADGQAGCFYFSRPSVGTTLVCMAHS